MLRLRNLVGFGLFLCLFTTASYAQAPAEVGRTIDPKNIMANNEFTWGVRAFHEGYYNKAMINFEKALTLKPQEPLYQLWLGFASYYTGLTSSALEQWSNIDNNEIAGDWLKSKADIINFRNSPYYDNLARDTWVSIGEAAAKVGKKLHFARPTSVVANPMTGGSFVVSYGNNSIAEFDINGNLLMRYTGGLVQFDGPWDVLPLGDGRFFVSEFRGRRISLINRYGLRLNSFGSTEADGHLSGPQYMASSEDGYLYVSDWATRRIVKYDFNGQYLMDIPLPMGYGSEANYGRPTGVAVGNNELYVVNADAKVIHVFDLYGNFIRNLGEGYLLAPEGIRLYQGRYLIVADGTRIMITEINDGVFTQLTDLSGKAQALMHTAVDMNGSLMTTDNVQNRLVYLSRLSNLYGGVSVEVRRIMADRFPKVTLEAVVQTREGTPLSGLKPENFLLYDDGSLVENLQVASLDRSTQQLNIALMVEASPSAYTMYETFLNGVMDVDAAVTGKGQMKTYLAGAMPFPVDYLDKTQYYTDVSNSTDAKWRFDATLRMAAGSLLPRLGKSAVFFLTTGEDNGYGFTQYQMDELIAYLKNNGISFYPIYVSQQYHSMAYDMIAQNTGGQSLYLFRPQGLNGVMDQILQTPSGVYTISYQSKADGSFGRKYLTAQLEVAVQKESGRTMSGYFSPLE
jgi:DNA-binding beta-propeller fold protein YncE